MGGMDWIKGGTNEQHSDKAENYQEHGVNSGRFEVQAVIFFIKSALLLFSELCFLPER